MAYLLLTIDQFRFESRQFQIISRCGFSYFNGKVPTRTLICVRCLLRNVRLQLCGILTYRHRTLSICFLCTVKQQTELFWSNLDFFFLGGQQNNRKAARRRRREEPAWICACLCESSPSGVSSNEISAYWLNSLISNLRRILPRLVPLFTPPLLFLRYWLPSLRCHQTQPAQML